MPSKGVDMIEARRKAALVKMGKGVERAGQSTRAVGMSQFSGGKTLKKNPENDLGTSHYTGEDLEKLSLMMTERKKLVKKIRRVTTLMRQKMLKNASINGNWYKLFKSYDRDNSGNISFAELAYVVYKELDISKLDAGGVEPQVEDFNVGDLLRALGTEFMPFAEERDIDLRMVPSNRIVRSDRQQLRRILQNLLSNAIRYTPPGGRVLVGCRGAGERVRFEVLDTGPGIPQDMRDAVFREFQRLPNDEGNEQGLGLGLAIVERITRMLGHTVELRSRPDEGSIFAVGVPQGSATNIRRAAAARWETAGPRGTSPYRPPSSCSATAPCARRGSGAASRGRARSRRATAGAAPTRRPRARSGSARTRRRAAAPATVATRRGPRRTARAPWRSR